MAKIAYIDHSYHKKTVSTDFLPEILRRHGHDVDYHWDEAWIGGATVRWDAVEKYDVVIMFQSFCDIGNQYFRNLHPNVVFIPMLDQFGVWQGPLVNLSSFWEPFQGSKVLSFSNALHAMAIGAGVRSFFARYYQPARERCSQNTGGLRGFFWLRRESEMPWALIRQLIAGTRFESFHVHLATDPGTPSPTVPSADDVGQFNITTSTWFESKSDFEAVLDKANVYFAPRLEEGIGQSFLEAMSRGQCVVAPNHGTMNEYIMPGLNGLLYDPKNPVALDFSDALVMGDNARVAVAYGRKSWEALESELVRFILTPSEELYRGKYAHPLARQTSVAGSNAAGGIKEQLRMLSRESRLLRQTRPIWHPIKRMVDRFF